MSEVSIKLLKDPYNLKLWQNLVQEQDNGITKLTPVEKLNDVRVVYQDLLLTFPMLVNYWIKYIKFEYELGNFLNCELIYTKAFGFLSYSIDLWISFLQFKLHTTPITSDTVGDLLYLFEAGREKIGYHYYSFEFYKLYLQFLNDYQLLGINFDKKYEILLRIIVEIPIYHYNYFFEKLLNLNNNNQLKYLTNDFKNFKKILIDIYITTQYKSYKLYEFEKSLTNYYHVKYLSQQELHQWDKYLDYVELNYPNNFIIQLYERSILTTANYSLMWTKYMNYLLQRKQYVYLQMIMKRCLNVKKFNNDKLFIKLINLQLYFNNNLLAKSLINSTSLPMMEKLLSLEWLFNYNDHEYLLGLFNKLILTNDYYFKIFSNFNLNNEIKFNFFKHHYNKFNNSNHYQDALNFWLQFNQKYRHHFNFQQESYDDKINIFLLA